MEAQLISSSKVSQNFAAILNQVKSQSIRFDIIQDQAIVAQICPPSKKVPIAELDQLFATLPKLDQEDIEAFEQDIHNAIKQLTVGDDVWE